MLIRLCEGPDLENLSTKVEPGAIFLRYITPDIYDRGEVTEVGDDFVVDFGDTVRRFGKNDVALVFGGVHEEHLMSHTAGEILKDFNATPAVHQVETLEDLLDFDKWLG